ncbi:MAG: response regulator [Myxococcales bacterium]|nr:response regulator [Myxococcales bacterium]
MNVRGILLIEDNPDDEALTIRALTKANILNSVVVARDGVEALEYLFCTGRYAGRSLEDLPQMVLLDLKLPKVDGLEVLRRLRDDERTRLLPVVVLTSSSEDSDVQRAYDLGANSYIRKPVDFVQFAESVRQIGLYWLVLNISSPPSARAVEPPAPPLIH